MEIELFSNADVPHFHQNRFENSIFPDIRCAPFPSKQIRKFHFFRHPVCPISIKTDLKDQFGQLSQNRFEGSKKRGKLGFPKDNCPYGLWLTASGTRRIQF